MEIDEIIKISNEEKEHEQYQTLFDKKLDEVRAKQFVTVKEEFAAYFKAPFAVKDEGDKILASYENTQISVELEQLGSGQFKITLIGLIIRKDNKEIANAKTSRIEKVDEKNEKRETITDAHLRKMRDLKFYKKYLEESDGYEFRYYTGHGDAVVWYSSFTELLRSIKF